jgi:hypothetical protein
MRRALNPGRWSKLTDRCVTNVFRQIRKRGTASADCQGDSIEPEENRPLAEQVGPDGIFRAHALFRLQDGIL